MPKYLLEASYTAEGAKGLAKEGGSSRRKMVTEMVKSMNGKVRGLLLRVRDYRRVRDRRCAGRGDRGGAQSGRQSEWGGPAQDPRPHDSGRDGSGREEIGELSRPRQVSA